MCVGIELCSKKNCLEQERCVHGIWPTRVEFIPRGSKRSRKKRMVNKIDNVDLRFKIDRPEIFGKIELKQFTCKRHRKHCLSDKACGILGQCMYDHPAVAVSKAFKKELNKAKNINEISNIFVSRLAKVKRKRKK